MRTLTCDFREELGAAWSWAGVSKEIFFSWASTHICRCVESGRSVRAQEIVRCTVPDATDDDNNISRTSSLPRLTPLCFAFLAMKPVDPYLALPVQLWYCLDTWVEDVGPEHLAMSKACCRCYKWCIAVHTLPAAFPVTPCAAAPSRIPCLHVYAETPIEAPS